MGVSDVSHAPGSVADPSPISLQQEFFCSMDKGDVRGAFGHKHTITFGWRVRGGVDSEILQAALDDIVVRHEILRSSISRTESARAQHVHPPCPVQLAVRDLPGGDSKARDRQAQDLINEVEANGYDVSELPHLRAFLGVFDDDEAVLVLIAHHIASDGWSMRVIMRDLTACYAARKSGRDPDLPVFSQYHEYARWQQEYAASAAVDKSAEYWRTTLQGGQIFAMKADRPKSEDGPGVYSTHRFGIDSQLTSATIRLANAMRSSPFMVLLAAYKTMLYKKFGVTDVIVATFTSSRGEERFQNTVGPFLNFLPLRTDLAGCANFRDVVARVRRTCLDAYTHDIPFERIEPEAPELMAPFGDPGLDVVAFEVLQFPSAMHNTVIGGLEYTEIRRRLVSQVVSSDIPDGALWALDILPDGDMAGSLKFSADIFDYATMSDLVQEFDTVLRNAVAGPDLPVNQL